MAISKVTYAGNTLIDLTGDTVAPENLLSGTTAHAANGEEITGIVEDKKGELEAQIADLRNQISSLNANFANHTAWAHGRLDGTTVNLKFSHNIESITTSDGHSFYVKFIKPFPDEYYAAVGSFEIGGIGQEIIGIYGYGAAGFSIDVQNASGNAGTPSAISVIALR